MREKRGGGRMQTTRTRGKPTAPHPPANNKRAQVHDARGHCRRRRRHALRPSSSTQLPPSPSRTQNPPCRPRLVTTRLPPHPMYWRVLPNYVRFSPGPQTHLSTRLWLFMIPRRKSHIIMPCVTTPATTCLVRMVSTAWVGSWCPPCLLSRRAQILVLAPTASTVPSSHYLHYLRRIR
jgi:hypothetical protein